MKKTSMTVTEASRNFADCVNRAHYQNVTFVLLKNGEPVARFVPDNEKVCVGRDLAEALAKTDLPQKEARAWHLGSCPQAVSRVARTKNRSLYFQFRNTSLVRAQLLCRSGFIPRKIMWNWKGFLSIWSWNVTGKAS
jgi:antitoxin (DNA-binding transcriptional repressor) of toxin-antitoxin stability system